MIGKFTTSSLFLLAILSFTYSQVSAQNTASFVPNSTPKPIEITQESVNPPDGISYLSKRIGEKLSMFISFSNESKVKNYRKIVNVRLSELKFIIENKKQGFFEKSTQRYFTTAGQLTLYLTSKNMKNEFVPVKEQLQSHIPVLTTLRDKYEPGTAEWRFVEDDINYIKGYIDSLSAE